jgi:RNA polymerase sigma-70 factor (ECF subfamily)
MTGPEAAASTHDYAELRQRLRSAVRSVCPPWLADQHDDFVQMSLMRILRSYPDAQINTAFLHRVAHSVVVDEIRVRKRRNEVGMSTSLDDKLEHEAAPSPEVTAQGVQLGEVVVQVLQELVADRRRALTLYLQGHNVPEISTLLAVDRKAAENLVYRGLADLREKLRARGFQPPSDL